MASLGDIWGATEAKPLNEKWVNRLAKKKAPFATDTDALLHIHHKIVAMQDEYNDEETEIDQTLLRQTTGFDGGAWLAILNCNVEWFGNADTKRRLHLVAEALLNLSHEDWLTAGVKGMKIVYEDDI